MVLWTAFPCALVLLVVAGGVVASWRVPSADEALVVTGRSPRVVRRRGALVVPGLARLSRVGLAAHEVDLTVEARSAEGIPCSVTVRGRWQVGGGDDQVVLAARHFSKNPDGAARQVEAAVAGRVRSTVGSTAGGTLADGGAPTLIAAAVAPAVADDLATLGLTVDGLEVAGIDDPAGYLADLIRPRLARATSERRIAEAEADAAAVRAEQATELTRARAQAELDLRLAE